jgi:hypothetical protein
MSIQSGALFSWNHLTGQRARKHQNMKWFGQFSGRVGLHMPLNGLVRVSLFWSGVLDALQNPGLNHGQNCPFDGLGPKGAAHPSSFAFSLCQHYRYWN